MNLSIRDEQDRGAGEAAVCLGVDVRLRLPERVDHADRGDPLPREVLQAQQLEPAQAGRPHRGLDLGLVEQCLERAGCGDELIGEVAKAAPRRHVLHAR
jgi:hypothetical protein